MPNFGIGAFLSNPKYYVGFSIPKIINNEFKNDVNNFSTEAEIRHYYLIAGYVFNISENLKFKPMKKFYSKINCASGMRLIFQPAN